MHGAGNMTPIETQYTVPTPTAPRTPAAWRALAQRRRAWLMAVEQLGLLRPRFRRSTAPARISS